MISRASRKRALKDCSNEDGKGDVKTSFEQATSHDVIDLTKSTVKKKAKTTQSLVTNSSTSSGWADPWEDSSSPETLSVGFAPKNFVHHIISRPSANSNMTAATAAALQHHKGIFLKARPPPNLHVQHQQQQQLHQQLQEEEKEESQHLNHQELVQNAPHRIRRSLPLVHKSSDPAHCLERIDDMYQKYYELEDSSSAKHGYMDKQQKDINSRMRAILIDWLVEVHHKFKLQSITLWLCMNILDRYLETSTVERAQLQLVGVTSLLIACKFEEIYPPEVRECVYITDYAYEREQVLAMEQTILSKLNYNICVPTGYHFLARYLEAIKASERTRLLSSYFSERNLQEYDMLKFKPHVFAAAALFIALKQQAQTSANTMDSHVSDDCWPLVLQEESGLMESDLLVCARAMVKHAKEEPETASKRRLNAVRKKYATDKFQFISTLPVPTIPP